MASETNSFGMETASREPQASRTTKRAPCGLPDLEQHPLKKPSCGKLGLNSQPHSTVDHGAKRAASVSHVVHQPPLKRCRKKTAPTEAISFTVGGGLDQLRQLNIKKVQQPQKEAIAVPEGCDVSGGQPPNKSRKYTIKCKISREGERSMISIWSKVKLFEAAR